MQHSGGEQMPGLLAPLNLGDRIPWKLDRSGEPQWLTSIKIDAEAAGPLPLAARRQGDQNSEHGSDHATDDPTW